jgi:trigger factor
LEQQRVVRLGVGQKFDVIQLQDELFKEQAERRVRLGILLGATVKKLELVVDQDRIKALIDEMASAYDDPEQVVNFYYSNEENLKQVEALAVEEQVAEQLLEKATTTHVEMSYADVMKSRQAQ